MKYKEIASLIDGTRTPQYFICIENIMRESVMSADINIEEFNRLLDLVIQEKALAKRCARIDWEENEEEHRRYSNAYNKKHREYFRQYNQERKKELNEYSKKYYAQNRRYK